jgi:hypothetical protein
LFELFEYIMIRKDIKGLEGTNISVTVVAGSDDQHGG